tara:strand:+ start:492 stop:2195 length:1704 start_codon:yes stop_codon:yes gene_type:complete
MKKYIQIIQFVLLGFSIGQNWSMTINAQDTNQLGASDYIILEMCENCYDSFHFGEDEYDLPSPPNYYTDIAFTNFDWVGTYDENNNQCVNPEFYIDKKGFHDPSELIVWTVGGFTNLPENNSSIELTWTFDELSTEYQLYIYIADTGYNMRGQNSLIIDSNELLVNYDPNLGTFSSNIEILIGGCASEGTTTYYYDSDGDGYGGNLENSQEFCSGFEPTSWVSNNDDVNDNFYCEENFIDLCNICNGENECLDCNNEPWGQAEIDDCGICSGGNTNHIPNSDMDCSQTCYGNAEIDDCDICDGFNQSCLNDIFLSGPENVYAYINNDIIELHWDQVNYPENEAIIGFNIYRNNEYIDSTTAEEYIVSQFADGEFCISAFDQYNNESQLKCNIATDQQEFCWTLKDGLNLISYPILPFDISVNNIFSSIDNYIEGIISEGDAASLLPNGIWVGSLTEIENHRAYWVKVDLGDPFATQEYCIVGYPIPQNLSYELSEGANLISYLGEDQSQILNALSIYNGNFEAIIGAANAAYNNPELGWVGSLINLKKGDGYWVIVNDNFIFYWLND